MSKMISHLKRSRVVVLNKGKPFRFRYTDKRARTFFIEYKQRLKTLCQENKMNAWFREMAALSLETFSQMEPGI